MTTPEVDKALLWTRIAVTSQFFFPVVAIIAGLLLFRECGKVNQLKAQLKTSEEYSKVLETKNVIIAKQEADLETHQKELLAHSLDTEASLDKTKAELDNLKVRYKTVALAHATTGPIIIPQVGPAPSRCVPNCVLSVGDSASIEVGEVVLKTDAGNYVVAGAAWVEDKDGKRLFGNSFNVAASKGFVKELSSSITSRGKFSYGLSALATTATKPMFGPSITAHLFDDHLELTGSGGLGMDAGYVHFNLSYRP
jgi:hypothetical protein